MFSRKLITISVFFLCSCAGGPAKVETASGRPEVTVNQDAVSVINQLANACINTGGTPSSAPTAAINTAACARQASMGRDLALSFVGGNSMSPTIAIDRYMLLSTPNGTRVVASRILQKTNAFGAVTAFEAADAETMNELQATLSGLSRG